MKRAALLLVFFVCIVILSYAQADYTLQMISEQVTVNRAYYYVVHPNNNTLYLYNYEIGSDFINIHLFTMNPQGELSAPTPIYTYTNSQPFAQTGGNPLFQQGFYQNGNTYLIFKNQQNFYAIILGDDGIDQTAVVSSGSVSSISLNGQMFMKGTAKIWCNSNGRVYILNLQNPANPSFYLLFNPYYASDYYSAAPMGSNHVYVHEYVENPTAFDYLYNVDTMTYTTRNVSMLYGLGSISADLGDNAYIITTGWSLDWYVMGYSHIFYINPTAWNVYYVSAWGFVDNQNYYGENHRYIHPLGNRRFLSVCNNYNNTEGDNRIAISALATGNILHEATFLQLHSIPNPYKLDKINETFYVATSWYYGNNPAELRLVNLPAMQISPAVNTNRIPMTTMPHQNEGFYNISSGSYGTVVQLYNVVPVTSTQEETLPTAPLKISAVPNPFNHKVTFNLSNTADKTPVSINIYDQKGRQVRKLEKKTISSYSNAFDWDGKDNNGKEVTNGIYLVKLKQGDRNSSVKILKY